MLRISPTEIPFTRADLDGLDERTYARQSARLARPRPSNIRLSPGPGRSTRLSFVSADQNIGRQRAASSSSDVVVEVASPKHFDGAANSEIPDAHRSPADLLRLRQDAARALEGVADQLRSPSRPSPSRQDSFYRDQQEIAEIEREIAEHSPASNLDGGPGPPDTGPRPFSSARARRRHARSTDDPGMHHTGIRPFSTQSQMWLNPVPQLVLPSALSQASLNQSLDPGAPVFVPRTRFGMGTETSSSGSRPWRSLDHTTSSSNLRARSSGELNMTPSVLTLRNGPAVQRSHGSDQNAGFPLPSPNLERYPLLRRPSAILAGPERSVAVAMTPSLAPSPRALSVSSRSTPNLLHPSDTHSRGSSFSWRHTSRQSSREGLDAAAEFLRMRGSPLDDLTERLSRLSAGRQRSVGRNWLAPERRGRPSLLTGDPFRQGPSSDTVEEDRPFVGRVEMSSIPYRREATEEDPVALAMALPPSTSPLLSGLPSTPPAIPGSTRSPPEQCSPVKLLSSPPPSIKRKPVGSCTVYDDAKPAATQPQTPADLTRSSRRAKNCSDAVAVQQSPVVTGRAIVASPNRAPLPPERNPYRNTYPPAPASERSVAASGSRAGRTRTRAQTTQRSSENEDENDIEGSLRGLEEDRRVWLGRREDGDLDATPPKEGRFERYLS